MALTPARGLVACYAVLPEGESLPVEVCVRRSGNLFTVFVNGGLLADGTDCAHIVGLVPALLRANDECISALLGM